MKYYQFLKYSRYTRYAVFFITLFLMIYSVKIYLNNFSIENNIARIKSNTVSEYQEMYFKENFYKAYLTGQYGKFFIQHENNILSQGELIIKFSHEEISKAANSGSSTGALISDISEKEKIINISQPKAAWHFFLNAKLNKIKENF